MDQCWYYYQVIVFPLYVSKVFCCEVNGLVLFFPLFVFSIYHNPQMSILSVIRRTSPGKSSYDSFYHSEDLLFGLVHSVICFPSPWGMRSFKLFGLSFFYFLLSILPVLYEFSPFYKCFYFIFQLNIIIHVREIALALSLTHLWLFLRLALSTAHNYDTSFIKEKQGDHLACPSRTMDRLGFALPVARSSRFL